MHIAPHYYSHAWSNILLLECKRVFTVYKSMRGKPRFYMLIQFLLKTYAALWSEYQSYREHNYMSPLYRVHINTTVTLIKAKICSYMI